MPPKFSAAPFNVNLEKALDLAMKAESEDRSKQYSEAFRYYKRALHTYLIVIEDMLFECIKYQERNEDLLRLLSTTDKYRKMPNASTKVPDDGTDFEPTSQINRLPGVMITSPDKGVKWTDVIGHDTAKFILKLAVLDRCPIRHPVMYLGKRKNLKTILLYGPSGTGKSYLLKAVGNGVREWTVFNVNVSSLVHCVTPGIEELQVKSLFKAARLCGWAVICLDNIEALCQPPKSSQMEQSFQKLKDAIKNEMSDIMQKQWTETVIVIAATHEPNKLDLDLIKKFGRKIYVPLPRPDDRLKILKQNIGKCPNTISEDDFIDLTDRMSNYTGAEISEVVRQAVKGDGTTVTLADLRGAIDKVKQRTTPEVIQAQLKFKDEHCPYE